MVAFNFPANPVKGQIHNVSPGVSYIYGGPTSTEQGTDIGWERAQISTALPKNYIVNPSMQVSQQNGSALGTNLSSYYMVDQWHSMLSAAGTTVHFNQDTSGMYHMPAASGWAEVGKASPLAVTDYFGISQPIEGQRVSDFKWGTAAAHQVVLAFTLYSTYSANFSVSIRNAAFNRTFIAKITVNPSGAFNRYTVVIPGDTTGVWPTTSATGMHLGFVFASGSNYVGTTGWQTGSFLTGPTPTNGLATNSWYMFSDVGLYLDPYKTGVAPPYEVPDPVIETSRCQRYWYKAFGLHGFASSATAASRMGATHPVSMRIAPTCTYVGSPRLFDGTVTPVMSGAITSLSTINTIELNLVSAGMVAGRPLIQYFTTVNDYIAVSARM